MAKRGYKLQEFAAHSSGVNCLNIGKKACRLLVTGGDDHKVNLWAIGKPTSLMSLCGHASPVESVTFDLADVLVLAGASTGAMKLWDLEETKMVRTLTGHRSSCTAVEFHPFGEFFASGSLDTNLRVWDIRKKGCIHTYKGHTGGISTIRFTPDGRWVVSGGFDNIVKVWDLTAGKLLHDFKHHEGHIRSIDFHPLEFLLATGSADRTVKFWDLETFELIGSARPEATGVRSITFHPDGRTLFCGLDESLKVYSWEPVICHDAVGMGWSTLGDLCIHEGKLLGCSYYRNSVGVWVADVSLIEPYGAGLVPEQIYSNKEHKFNIRENQSSEKVGSGLRSTGLQCRSPEHESKDIKNIYVDSSAGRPVGLQRVGSFNSQKLVPPLESKEISCLPAQKQSPAMGTPAKSTGQAVSRSFVVPSVVPRDSYDGKYSTNSRRESISMARSDTGMMHKTAHRRRPSNSKYDMERLSMAAEPGTFVNMSNELDNSVDSKFNTRLVLEDEAKECSEEKHTNMKTVAEKFEKTLSPQSLNCQENHDESLSCSNGTNSVKIVNGVVLVSGRTRSLVEKFERRERFSSDVDQVTNTSPQMMPETVKTSSMLKGQPQISGRDAPSSNDENVTEDLVQNHDVVLSTLRSRLTKLQVVRHFWERNDTKGAINAMRKLPDHSVQADVISVLMEKMEFLNLDLFSCLLPILTSLLGSKMERHANVSLEMLLKLVAVFGPVVRATVSAPPSVGVDLQAEQRLQCCNQCSVQLQKIQKILPSLIKRGGVLAKCAQELNLVLQES
ncbi:katanin p80 WD40 repeat-containing subunit B1 homolog KTN80.2-like isoform X2 [Malania oleifera]|uniref:katanin p80 WD40 repeat-containing subunit B1 homolog KTN80.2-like isoform X2 n=1 Tax=Malania oleifera TaxID=397392 RepID=UPI0025AE196A|nr:katanin p80 WD40 repeat-containing subunit B1 homolog KTN80.2-like isoform X2 [Malania oleifera]